MDRLEVTLATDGACKGNPGPGGYGAILQFKGHEHEIAGYEPETTNNRMELRAVIEGVRALKKPCLITIVTDSQYVCNGIATARARMSNGWKTASGSKVKNIDLWQELTDVGIKGKHKFQCLKVEGHRGHDLNERCDKLAKLQIEVNTRSETHEERTLVSWAQQLWQGDDDPMLRALAR